MYDAKCDADTGECIARTPTPVATVTFISTYTPIPATATQTSVPTSTAVATATAANTPVATPIANNKYPNGPIQTWVQWVTTATAGVVVPKKIGNQACVFAVEFDVPSAGTSTAALAAAGNVVFQASYPTSIYLGTGGPCLDGEITVAEPTGSGAFRVTLGYYNRGTGSSAHGVP